MRKPKFEDFFGDPSRSTTYREIDHERKRAHDLHDSHGGSMERKTWDDLLEWTTVTGEEVGEIDKAINEYRHGNLTDQEFRDELRKEVRQCAAMYAAWLEAFQDAY